MTTTARILVQSLMIACVAVSPWASTWAADHAAPGEDGVTDTSEVRADPAGIVRRERPALVAEADPVQHEEVARVISQVGLLGTWSTNCAAPASYAAPRSIYFVASDGAVMRRFDLGNDHRPVDFTILSAHALPENRVEVTDQLGRDTYRIVLYVHDGHYRSLQSRSDKFGILIENGIQKKDGKSTRWLERCPG